MPEDLILSQIGSSQLPPPFRGLHSPGVRKHCQIIFACYSRKSTIMGFIQAGGYHVGWRELTWTTPMNKYKVFKYKIACMCFSAINGSGPAYLSELLHVYTPSRTLRSSSDTRMLEIQQYKHKTHGFRTFSCFGPHIWNSLPQRP